MASELSETSAARVEPRPAVPLHELVELEP